MSTPTIRISIASIALGLSVMIMTVAIVTGFKLEIRNKITGVNGHITITNFESSNNYETSPVNTDQSFYPEIVDHAGIKHIQVFATKAAIVKADEDVEGIILKGVGKEYNWDYVQSQLADGSRLNVVEGSKSNGVIISESLSKQMKLSVGDALHSYFIQQPPRVRKFEIQGIYQNNLEVFDNLVYCDIGHIQKINNWGSDRVGGFEILIDDFDDLDQMYDVVNDIAGHQFMDDGSSMLVESVEQKYSQLFNWTSLFDTNTYFILTLMFIVAGINMISGLLILILEKTNMIGILKAVGSRNWSVRKIFLYNALFIIGKGVIIGNIIGLGLCFAQQYFGLIKLDPASYYVSLVPIELKLVPWLLLNIGTIFITLMMLILPSYIVTRISPIKAIRFE
jgi:lipoprotein-releasing system permease protein